MRRSFFLVACIFSLFAISCSNSESVVVHEYVEDADHPGLLKIYSSSKSVFLGTDDTLAPVSERPRMLVSFDYDFALGEHEVTQGEFHALMPKFALPEGGENLPVVGITYFDAVLFANERSKKERLDTAYSYVSAHFDSLGSCTGLDALVFNPGVAAYRLPTEAEWVFAALPSWNPDDGWHNENSGFLRHDVCGKKKNALGLCDMAGNVMEWTNDWLGYFRDTAFTDYLGASDGGRLGERVVKGGYYGTAPVNMNVVARGDVYTVLSSSKYPYVGFRLAFGAIPDGVWTNSNGASVLNRTVPLASVAKLKSLTHTSDMRLAFRDDVTGNLNYVDYRNGILSVMEIADTLDAYHPDISPDGNFVAFCTKPEGVSGKSEIFVRRLAPDDSWILKLDVSSAAIPRWTILENGDTAIVYVTDAGSNKDEFAWKAQSTWSVTFKSGALGTPRKLFDGSFNGGVSPDGNLAVSGASLLRAKLGANESYRDSVWYNEEQACNASLAKDGSKRTLFLDFGGKTGEAFVGEKYGTHERILVVDSLGTLIQSVPSEPGYTYDHTEWTNVANLAISTLANSNGAHNKIAVVYLNDSSVVELFSGEELWHPVLWVKDMFVLDSTESVLDADSAGQYYAENGSSTAAIVRTKLEVFWHYKDSINTVVLGSSRPSTSVDPLLFSDDINAINLSLVPNIVYTSRYLFENYLLNHATNLKNVVISLDIDLWNRSEIDPVNNFFGLEYKSFPGYVYDENHGFWKNESPKGMFEYTKNNVRNDFEYERHSYHKGVQHVPYSSDFNWETENPGVDFDSTWLDYKQTDFQNNWNHLIAIIEKSAERGINVVGVVFPQSPGYKNTGAFGRYGLRRSDAARILSDISALSEKYSNFKLLDENKMGDHDYPESMAINRDHLQNNAASQMTSRIDSVLHSF